MAREKLKCESCLTELLVFVHSMFWSLFELSYESAKKLVKFLTRSFIKNGMIQERLTAIFRHPMINSTYKFKKKRAHYLNDSSLLRCRTRFHTIKIESRPKIYPQNYNLWSLETPMTTVYDLNDFINSISCKIPTDFQKINLE